MCAVGLPVLMVPLWQVAHDEVVTMLCANVEGTHAVVRWQLSHAAVVGMCLVDLPVALVPLWQVLHDPGVTPV